MRMRMPKIPLFTIDPYFSVWSQEPLNEQRTKHWTDAPCTVTGTVTVDGTAYRFLGAGSDPCLPQTAVDADALTTSAVYEGAGIRLTARFLSPLLADDLYLCSRPVAYLHLAVESLDGAAHTVTARLACSEELVLNHAGEGRAWSEAVPVDGLSCVRMGSGAQPVLQRCGDDLRIDWGYLYLAVRGSAATGNQAADNLYAVYAETTVAPEALFLLGYDDIHSLTYFGQPVDAYWKKGGKTITAALQEAADEYELLQARCDRFSAALAAEATAKGGEEYAELLLLAYRQVMAAHKLALDPAGEVLYVSKECFSNGCAATVDVTYPSAPLYLYYNTELLKGMLRPVFRYARSEEWPYDYAPHDVGTYPLLNGQAYGKWGESGAPKHDWQMPVEECGNILILMAAITEKEGSAAFAQEHMDLLEIWVAYLERYGEDPENQLCTDDFAGHLAHNCNLSLKAILGLAGYARILRLLGRTAEAAEAEQKAKTYAESFLTRAANADGSTRLAYDRPDTFSLKYNAVWDKVWKTGLLPESFYAGETARYKAELLPYGVPLDSRERYTKSDWTLWVACMAPDAADFRLLVHRLWLTYDNTHQRVPMTDWYYANTAEMVGFRNRTVQGGLFLRLLLD